MKSKFTFSLLSILSLAALVGCKPNVSLPSAEKPTEEKPTEKVTASEQTKESTSNKDPNAYVAMTTMTVIGNSSKALLPSFRIPVPMELPIKLETLNLSGVRGRRTSTGLLMMFLRTESLLSRLTSTISSPKDSNPVKRSSMSLRVTPIRSWLLEPIPANRLSI